MIGWLACGVGKASSSSVSVSGGGGRGGARSRGIGGRGGTLSAITREGLRKKPVSSFPYNRRLIFPTVWVCMQAE